MELQIRKAYKDGLRQRLPYALDTVGGKPIEVTESCLLRYAG